MPVTNDERKLCQDYARYTTTISDKIEITPLAKARKSIISNLGMERHRGHTPHFTTDEL
jgi:hypothetical protein